MIDIKIKVKFEGIKDFLRKFRSINRGIGNDGFKLANGCYKYLKTIIPVSKLNKPHLRDSFNIRVNYLLEGVIIGLYPDGITYAPFIDTGVSIPTRYPRNKKAMKFEGSSGDIVFTKKAKGFKLKGIQYVRKGERWMIQNAHNFIDFTLQRYLK